MQTPNNDQHRPDDPLQAPPRLVAELKRRSSKSIFVPPSVDEQILAAVRRHFARQERPKWKWFLPWIAAAAAAIVLIAVIPQFSKSPTEASSIGKFPLEDINHDGHVDILDAFALARQLKSGPVSNLQLDLNHDGVVDDRDVASLASRAVQLPKGGRS